MRIITIATVSSMLAFATFGDAFSQGTASKPDPTAATCEAVRTKAKTTQLNDDEKALLAACIQAIPRTLPGYRAPIITGIPNLDSRI